MLSQIKEIVDSGFKPFIYIDAELFKGELNSEIKRLKKKAREFSIPVYHTSDTDGIKVSSKMYIFRYGHIPISLESKIKKKGGKIVSGNLDV